MARARLTRSGTEPGEEPRPVAVTDAQSTRFATEEQADELALKIARAWGGPAGGPGPGIASTSGPNCPRPGRPNGGDPGVAVQARLQGQRPGMIEG